MSGSAERDPWFQSHRSFLLGVAYRMLGTLADAEDVVQETFLRAQRADLAEVDAPRAWLTRVVTNLCLDQLKSARAKRESYSGQWLPEPIRTDHPNTAVGAVEPERLESISLAFLVLLETLSPLERAAFVLHEVFEYSHAEVAQILSRDVSAVRQLVHRARAHIKAGRPRFEPNSQAHRDLVANFLRAVGAGDVAAIERLLTEDVQAVSDGGGKVAAALRPISGPDRVARFAIGTARKGAPGAQLALIELNGEAALTWSIDGRVFGAVTFSVRSGRIARINVLLNPEKLQHV